MNAMPTPEEVKAKQRAFDEAHHRVSCKARRLARQANKAVTSAERAALNQEAADLRTLISAAEAVATQEGVREALKPFVGAYLERCQESRDAAQVGGHVPLDDDFPVEVPCGLLKAAHDALTQLAEGGAHG